MSLTDATDDLTGQDIDQNFGCLQGIWSMCYISCVTQRAVPVLGANRAGPGS